MTLSQHWERHAKAWIAWSRSSPHDGFWDGTWPELHAVLPPPHGWVVDVGCGEGRLSRKLQPLGYDVVALDRSPTLLRAAFVANATIPAVLADAAAVPLRDGRASLVVACMVLLDVDDLSATLREASRILTQDGVICFAIVHPFSSAQDEDVWTNTTPVYGAPYLQDRRYEMHIARDGHEMTFASMHRPLSRYVDALSAAGFVITALREYGDQLIPWLLVVRAEKR